jgi:2-phospho-L-lactate guanylyltransferase
VDPLRRPDLARPWAIVPLRGLESAKTRLGGELDPEERLELVIAMAELTLAATRDASHVVGTVLVTADPAAGELAERFGARPLVQRIAGLNGAIVEARAVAAAAGATAIVVLPIDLAAVTAAAIDEVIEAADRAPLGRPVVLLVPDRHGSGTNALAIAPAAAIEPAFGPDSRAVHRAAAAAAGATYLELAGPLTLDVDTADDLLVAQRISAEAGPPGSP